MRAGRVLTAAVGVAALLLGAAACGHVAAPAKAPQAVAHPASAPAPAAPSVPAAPAARPATPPPPIPILMYHVIAAPPAKAPFPGLYVTPRTFAAQMAALRAAGYHALSMPQAYAIWRGRAPAPVHPIVLSFDNGYTSQFTQALPLLKSYGWPGVLNLVVDRLNAPDGLTTAQVRTMIADGWDVEDQTFTHPDLRILSPQVFHEQTVGAAQKIRSTFGVPVRFFCYPSGDYDPAVVAALRNAGFLAAVTVWPGAAYPAVQGALTLDRVRVSYRESAATLVAALRYYAAHKPAPPPVAYPPPVARRAAKPAGTTPTTKVATASATAKPTATSSASASGSAKPAGT